MKKILATLLILCFCLCLCPLTAWAEGEEKPLDEQTVAKLFHTVYDANRPEALFSRHESLRYLFSSPDAPDGYDVIWETRDAYYQSYADWFAVWEKNQVCYEMRWDTEANTARLYAGYDYDHYYDAFYYVGETLEDFYDAKHESSLTGYEADGRVVLSAVYDESKSKTAVEDLGLEYAGQIIHFRLIVDAESYDILSACQFVIVDGEESFLSTVDFAYDQPEPIACRALRAAFERDARRMIDMSFVFDPGTDHESVKTLTLPVNTDCRMMCSSVPYVYFYDLEQTAVSGWDGLSDLTIYVYTNPDEALIQRFREANDVAAPQGLVLKDGEGNVLEDGATLSGRYYYKVYVEGVPEETEAIQTAWSRGVLNAEEHEEWAARRLHTDEGGRYIFIIPVVGEDYTQETMFARLDEDNADEIRINFLYDRETVRDTAEPELVNEEGPRVGETDYTLRWEPVEGAELYEVLWYTPSGEILYYGVTEPEFCLSDKEGALDELGEYALYILPYGDGMPFTYGAWTVDITE